MVWLLVVILLSNILMYHLLSPAENHVAEEQGRAPSVEEDNINVFTLDTLRRFSGKKMHISINGTAGQALVLQLNNRVIASKISTGHVLPFDDVSLSDGRNEFVAWAVKPGGASELIDSFTVTIHSARLKYLSRPLYSVLHRPKQLALTFDGGSSDKGTLEILDILKTAKVRCTMFLTGRFIQNFPHLVERILADGHEIGNHTYNHPHLTSLEKDGGNTRRDYVDEAYMSGQLNGTDSIFYSRFNQHLKPYWRAPFGEINPRIVHWAAKLGFRHVGWSAHCDSWDWVADTTSKLYRSPADIEAHFLALDDKTGLSGKIILMHLGSERSKEFPYQSLADLIQRLHERGYRLVKISELLQPPNS